MQLYTHLPGCLDLLFAFYIAKQQSFLFICLESYPSKEASTQRSIKNRLKLYEVERSGSHSQQETKALSQRPFPLLSRKAMFFTVPCSNWARFPWHRIPFYHTLESPISKPTLDSRMRSGYDLAISKCSGKNTCLEMLLKYL